MTRNGDSSWTVPKGKRWKLIRIQRKGGGRESGTAEERAGKDGLRPASSQPVSVAAANPAVESLADFIIPKAAVNPAAHHREVAGHCDIHHRPVWMCIRELEAELVLPDDWELCPTCGRTRDGAAERIRELEAAGDDLYAECKKQFDRAERAEALLDAEKVRFEEELSTLKLILRARDIALQKRLHA